MIIAQKGMGTYCTFLKMEGNVGAVPKVGEIKDSIELN